MKRFILVSFALFVSAVYNPISVKADSQYVSTSTKVEWPDYGPESWVKVMDTALIFEIQIPVENNDYVDGPGRYDIRIGTVTAYMNSEENPTVKITDGNILGKGVVVRFMEVRGAGLVARQLKVGGVWRDIPANATIRIEVPDAKKVVFNNDLKQVILRIFDGDKEVMKVVVENKVPAKSKK